MPRRKSPQRRTYDTDLTDGQWELVAPLIPEANPGGRPRKASSRELVNAILYFLRAGMSWRLLPHDLPPWQTVYYYFRRWGSGGRMAAGSPYARHGRPGAHGLGTIALGRRPRQPDRPDGRSKRGCKDYDAGKKIHGRKRHILTDTDGRLLAVEVHAADVQDRNGAKGVLSRSRPRFLFVERVYADGGYAGRLVGWARPKRIWPWRS